MRADETSVAGDGGTRREDAGDGGVAHGRRGARERERVLPGGVTELGRARPRRGVRELRRETVVRAGLGEVFAFFADAGNLNRITPGWLGFRVLTRLPVEMCEGAVIEYRVRLYGVSFFWRTRIVEWSPPGRFVDFQERGPYLWWRHTHEFEACGSGTRVRDVVEYAAPVRVVSEPLVVTRSVRRIFDYREERLRAILGGA